MSPDLENWKLYPVDVAEISRIFEQRPSRDAQWHFAGTAGEGVDLIDGPIGHSERVLFHGHWPAVVDAKLACLAVNALPAFLALFLRAEAVANAVQLDGGFNLSEAEELGLVDLEEALALFHRGRDAALQMGLKPTVLNGDAEADATTSKGKQESNTT